MHDRGFAIAMQLQTRRRRTHRWPTVVAAFALASLVGCSSSRSDGVGPTDALPHPDVRADVQTPTTSVGPDTSGSHADESTSPAAGDVAQGVTPTTSTPPPSQPRVESAPKVPPARPKPCQSDCTFEQDDPAVYGAPLAKSEGSELVDFRAARRWWGDPLLRSSAMPSRANSEAAVVQSDAGVKGDPRARGSAVFLVYYDNAAVDPNQHTYFGLVKSGAHVAFVRALGPGSFGSPGGHDAVVVRDHPGWYFVSYREPDGGNADYQAVHWTEPRSDGTTVQWTVASNPRLFSRAELVAFADSLAAV